MDPVLVSRSDLRLAEEGSRVRPPRRFDRLPGVSRCRRDVVCGPSGSRRGSLRFDSRRWGTLAVSTAERTMPGVKGDSKLRTSVLRRMT